jgi:murein DD-endopeptidase MepM/ murein hydrolase activator NlpD
MLRQSCIAITALTIAACAGTAAPPASRPPRDITLKAEAEIIEAVVPRHATLDSILRQYSLRTELVEAAVRSAAGVFNPRRLRAERPYRLVRSLDGLLREFEYQIDADRFLRIVNRDPSEPALLDAQILPYEKTTEIVSVRGAIDAAHPSLVAAMTAAGETIQLAMSLADVMSGQIDFQSDLQPGDAFDVLFEKSTREGQFAGYGALLGARVSADGREHQAFRWINPATGRAAYYDESGRSLKRFMLRSPLKFEPRITSGFSRSRLHPVFRTYRAHLGIDYGAPAGSPVVAVANGAVVSAGWAGGGGNQVRLRHDGGYESLYLHLSSFASGVRAGSRVAQGQLIGYVGSTGTATGPHLDYRLKRNGVFLNPLQEHRRMPPGDPIPAAALAGFFTMRDDAIRQMAGTVLASAGSAKPDVVKARQ